MGIQQQHGSSLVEVLVALFIFAIGLLGILALQAKSIQFNQSAYAYSQAVYLASGMAEQIKANTPDPENTFPYTIEASGYTPGNQDCTTGACSAADLAEWDKKLWWERVTNALPGGSATISREVNDGRYYALITVSFDDSRADDPDFEPVGGGQAQSTRQQYKLLVGL